MTLFSQCESSTWTLTFVLALQVLDLLVAGEEIWGCFLCLVVVFITF